MEREMSGQYGINMKQFCREHEKKMLEADATEELLEEHLRMITWIQHERLVHLIVTVMVVICELFVADRVLLHPDLGIAPAAIMLGLAILLGFYFWHYFFLENTVQRWYRIAEEMRKELQSNGEGDRTIEKTEI